MSIPVGEAGGTRADGMPAAGMLQVAWHRPGHPWTAGNPDLDEILNLWRRTWNREESRPARWSELTDHLRTPLRAGLALILHRPGLRPPLCRAITPGAAALLDLPPGFRGSGWPDASRARALGMLVCRTARGQCPARSRIPRPGRPGFPVPALTIPLSPEPGAGMPERCRMILLALAPPVRVQRR